MRTTLEPTPGASVAPLRFLIIDDNPDDRCLVIRELRREFPEAEFVEVRDQTQFLQSIESGEIDLVVTDFQIRWTDGLHVLRTLKGRRPDLPIVMFTGTGSEEIAVQAMKSGLEDYVLKSSRNLSQLRTAVLNALKGVQRRKELERAEQRYSELFHSVPVGLFLATPEGRLVDANPALVELLGYNNRERLLQTPLPRFFVRHADFHRFRETIERDGKLQHFEALLRRADHSLCWVDCHASVVRDPRTRAVRYEGSLEDVTERKKADLEREDLISHLQEALGSMKSLRGLLPICAGCKKIRDGEGAWNQLELYIQRHTEAEFTHSFCPECARSLYPEVFAEGSNPV